MTSPFTPNPGYHPDAETHEPTRDAQQSVEPIEPPDAAFGDQPVIVDPNASAIRLLKLQREWDWLILAETAGSALISSEGRVAHFKAQLRHAAREKVLRRADAGLPQRNWDLMQLLGDSAFQLSAGEKAELLGGDGYRAAARDGSLHGARPASLARGPSNGGNDARDMRRTMTEFKGAERETERVRVAELNDSTTLAQWLRVAPSDVLGHMTSPLLADPTARQPLPYEASVVAWARTLLAIGRLHTTALPAAANTWLREDAAVRAGDTRVPAHAVERRTLVDLYTRAVPQAAAVADAIDGRASASSPAHAHPRPNAASAPPSHALPAEPERPTSWRLDGRAVPPPPAARPSSERRSPTNGPPGHFDDAPPHTDADAPSDEELGAWDTPFDDYLAPDAPRDSGAPFAPGTALPYHAPDAPTPERVEPAVPRVGAAPPVESVTLHTAGGPVFARLVRLDGNMADVQTQVGAPITRIGPLSRDDGPAVEHDTDPRRDRYIDAGTERILGLPPVLSAERSLSATVFQAWLSTDYAGADAKAVAAEVLRHWPNAAIRDGWLRAMRESTSAVDRVFAAAYDTGFGWTPPAPGIA